MQSPLLFTETNTLKKILTYSAVAVVLGLLLTLVPLFTLAEFKAESSYAERFCSIPNQMKNLETTYSLDAAKYSVAGFEVLAISFTVAIAAYALLKWRMPH